MNFTFNSAHIGLAEHKSRAWCLTLPAGVEYKNIFSPDAWKHIAEKFTIGDLVHVRSEDHQFFAMLYVRASDKLWVQVEELFFKRLGDEPVEDSGAYFIKWSSPKTLFAVYRKADKERIKDGFQTVELAQMWLDSHLQKTAA